MGWGPGTPAARPYPKPWQATPGRCWYKEIEWNKSKIIRIDIYNSDYLFKFIYRYEKLELFIWINQIVNKYQYMFMYSKITGFCIL